MFANGFVNFTSMTSRSIAGLLPDILFLGGVAAIIWGVHLWSVPLAFIVGGVAAAIMGVFAVRPRKLREKVNTPN